MKNEHWQKTQILNVKVEFPKLGQVLAWCEQAIKYNKVVQITTPNPEQVVLGQKDKDFLKILNDSDLAICDGIGLAWAAKRTFSERLSGTDLMLALCQKAKEKNWKIFLLGGKPGVAKKTADMLSSRAPRSAGAWRSRTGLLQPRSARLRNDIMFDPGSADIARQTEKENQAIIQKINAFKPNLLFVAYGAPYQEKWIAKNLPQLKVNVAMGVGGAFDYIAGKLKRAPEWMQSAGLEWLWRLFCQPWRLKRQLALIKFTYFLLIKD